MGLDEIRQKINRIDAQIKELFLERMECSKQVAEEKKKTNGSVYVPEREAEIIARGLLGVPEEKKPEYEMLLRQVIVISRTYQYSMMDLPEDLKGISGCKGELLLEFFSSGDGNQQLLAAVTALKTAGIEMRQIHTEACGGGKVRCHMKIAGDFETALAKGAVLQIYEENENASVQKNVE